MCGIVALIGSREAAPQLLEGLRQLEYRGYDSAGIATVELPEGIAEGGTGRLHCLRAEGKLVNLSQRFDERGAPGHCGIGHTRWATHGKPEERNAHPHLDGSGQLAVVQNGIIENHRSLREELQGEGVSFLSDTDTEVIPHLVARRLRSLEREGHRPDAALLLRAVQEVLPLLHGAYALAVVWAKVPGALVVARRQAPLLIGLGEGEFLCASDTPALAGFTRTILPLEDGEVALLTPLGIELYDAQGGRVQRTPSLLSGTEHVADKRSFRHFMLKEIHEQPETAALWVARHLPEQALVALPFDDAFYEGVERIEILACGTSRHAAQVGAYLLEQLAGIPTRVHYASEFRYAPPPLVPHTLTIGVTQSGETADTLAALAMEQGRRQAGSDPPWRHGCWASPTGRRAPWADWCPTSSTSVPASRWAWPPPRRSSASCWPSTASAWPSPNGRSARDARERRAWPACASWPTNCASYQACCSASSTTTTSAAPTWPTCSPTPRT
jgi:glucosamine--fructose-6-phosphate aminotransferase (isomerizing)